MSWLSQNLTGHNKNPSESANEYLSQIPDVLKQHFIPYINQGKQAGDKLTSQYDEMTQNPGALFSRLGEGYKESPGYQSRLKAALQGATHASAAGGMLGTPTDQQQQGQVAGDIASQDYDQYINHILGLFGLGQQGQQKMQEQGFNADTSLGENLGNVLGTQGQYAYGGTAGENQNRSQNWSNLFQGLALMGHIPGLDKINPLPSRSYG